MVATKKETDKTGIETEGEKLKVVITAKMYNPIHAVANYHSLRAHLAGSRKWISNILATGSNMSLSS